MPANLYQRNGLWYARIQSRGVDLRRSLQTRDKREAAARLKMWLKDNSAYYGTVRRTYAEAAGAWTIATEASRKAKTWTRYSSSLRMLEPHFGEMFIDAIGKPQIQAFVDARKAEGLSVATIRRDLTVLSGIMEWAVEADWIAANPVPTIGKRSMRYKPPVFVRPSDADVEAVFAECWARQAELARFILATGMRRDEAVFLTHAQVDAKRGSARLDDTKNSSVRTVSLNREALAIYKRQPVDIECPEFVFTTRNHGPYKRATEMMREANDRAQKKAQKAGRKLARVMLHDLRHLYSIRYLENGGNLYLLQQQLGHGSIRQTEFYLRFLTPEAAQFAKSGQAQNPAHSA